MRVVASVVRTSDWTERKGSEEGEEGAAAAALAIFVRWGNGRNGACGFGLGWL